MAKFLRAIWGWLALLLAGLLAVGGYWLYGQNQAEQARAQALASLRTEVVARGSLVSNVSATGSLQPERQANLFFLAPGTVAEVLVQSGDTVQAGQVLARLDDVDLRLAVRQAEDALAVAKLNRDKLLAGPSEGDIAVAKANVRSANAQLSDLLRGAGSQEVEIATIRYDNLRSDHQKAVDQYNAAVQFAKDFPQFAPPQDTLDALKAGVESAFFAAEVGRLQLQKARQGADKGAVSVGYARVAHANAVLEQVQAPATALQIAQADLAVRQAETALAQAKLRAGRAQLTAPFDGVVSTVNAKAGEPAAAGGLPAFVLLDTSRYHVDVPVDEVDVALLSAGQPVLVSVDALPGAALTGQVERIAPTAAVIGGVVNYTVRVVLDPTEAVVRPGMSATADIVVAEVRDVLLVPNWAIRRDRRTGQAFASLKFGDVLKEVPIETGLRGETHTEVRSGVHAGDVAAVSTARESISFFGGGG